MTVFASILTDDESLTFEQGHAPHAPETEDYKEMQIASGDPEQDRLVQDRDRTTDHVLKAFQVAHDTL